MNHHFSETDIWALIEEKDFAQLDDFEKNQVRMFLTDAEYEQRRKLSVELKERLGVFPMQLEAKAEMAKEIFASGKKKRKSLIKRLVMYQVPAWKAAAACVFLAMSFYFLPRKNINGQNFNPEMGVNQDSLSGVSLEEDSALSRFMIEVL
ncbi:MAG: hypothetical protein AAF696_12125 [Bacteroidota bacterium]